MATLQTHARARAHAHKFVLLSLSGLSIDFHSLWTTLHKTLIPNLNQDLRNDIYESSEWAFVPIRSIGPDNISVYAGKGTKEATQTSTPHTGAHTQHVILRYDQRLLSIWNQTKLQLQLNQILSSPHGNLEAADMFNLTHHCPLHLNVPGTLILKWGNSMINHRCHWIMVVSFTASYIFPMWSLVGEHCSATLSLRLWAGHWS